MAAPWNIRITPGYHTEMRRLWNARPDWFRTEILRSGKRQDVGTSRTWFEAFLMGLIA
jgi:hypothetical protein